MILVAGIAEEPPVARVTAALDQIGADYRLFDQRKAASTELTLVIGARADGAPRGCLTLDGEVIPLEAIRAVYLRLMDDRLLPETAAGPGAAARRSHCRTLHQLVQRFADIAVARVLNRPSDMASNHSKPFQAHAIRASGFQIPDTLITNDPAVAREFITSAWRDGGAVIYKSVSGVRSIVQLVKDEDLPRLDSIRWCPTQFQRQVVGIDIRVHVVGHTVIATAITSEAVDYRYSSLQSGVEARLAPLQIEADVRRRCILLAHGLNLPLAGIDLRRTVDGLYCCFEVNPSPAFSFYEQRTGVSIASCIARYLAGEAD